MDIAQAAAYFDLQQFDAYNFGTSSWDLAAFEGQLKLADSFVSIWNRPTRKRMIYTAPGNEPTSTVVRVPQTGNTYLVGTGHADVHDGFHYRTVTSVHECRPATVSRLVPAVVSGVKGWAEEEVVRATFADAELRSVNEGQEKELTNYGHYFLFLPAEEPVQRHDVVTLGGVKHYVLEVYVDSGYTCARTTVRPDERVNFEYVSKGAVSYSTANQTVSSSDTTYKVTGKRVPEDTTDFSGTPQASVKLMLLESMISFSPKPGDSFTLEGKTYRVASVRQDSILREWYVKGIT